MIDWPACINAYNRDHKTLFKTRKKIIGYLYEKLKSYDKVGAVLYVSGSSIQIAMQEDKIEHLPKGHRFPSKKTALIMKYIAPDKTAEKIAKEVGCSASHVRKVASTLGLEYKNLGRY